jgi:LPS O-antigen subunit length determinant protein (WzzB/FepE family)
MANVNSLGNGNYEIGDDDYWLVENSYSPEEEQLIKEYLEYNKEDVEQEIVNQAHRNYEIERDYHDEYRPEDRY